MYYMYILNVLYYMYLLVEQFLQKDLLNELFKKKKKKTESIGYEAKLTWISTLSASLTSSMTLSYFFNISVPTFSSAKWEMQVLNCKD